MTLNAWLKKIEQPVNTDRDLDRVLTVAKHLNLLEKNTKIITVTGTNGKGSCVEMLTSVYVNAGYKVGTYTSPHLFSFNERIRIQKEPVSDSFICHAFEKIEQAQNKILLSYFEWVTLAALFIFKQHNLDIIILEVGIGGRLDATNILDADLAIITSIGLDHTDYLGNTREAIAQEKAGILRSNQLAICGDPSPPETLINIAKKLNTEIFYINKDFSFPDLQPTYLLKNNAEIVLKAILLLNKLLPVNIEQAIQSIITTKLPGRCEVQKAHNNATIIFDVAHNPHAVEQLAKCIKTYSNKKIIALFSMLQDKDISATIHEIKNYIHEWHIGKINHPRGATKKQLESAFEQHHILPKWHSDLKTANEYIRKNLQSNDVYIIFGSFYLISELH